MNGSVIHHNYDAKTLLERKFSDRPTKTNLCEVEINILCYRILLNFYEVFSIVLNLPVIFILLFKSIFHLIMCFFVPYPVQSCKMFCLYTNWILIYVVIHLNNIFV